MLFFFVLRKLSDLLLKFSNFSSRLKSLKGLEKKRIPAEESLLLYFS